MDEKLKKQLIKHEGCRLKPYKCSEGKLTIGIGRNLEDNGITKLEAMFLFETDLKKAKFDFEAIIEHFGISKWRINKARQDALINVAFNIGRRSLLGFKKMWGAVKVGNWEEVAKQLLDSKYANDVGYRAEELAKQLKEGMHQNGF